MFFIIECHCVIIKNGFLRADKWIVWLHGTDGVCHGAIILSGRLEIFLMHDQIFGEGQQNLLCCRTFIHIFNNSNIFIMRHAHDPADAFGTGVSGRIGKDFCQIRCFEVVGLGQRLCYLLVIKTKKLLSEQINDFHDGAHTPAAELRLFLWNADGGVAVCPRKKQVGYYISYVITHRAEEGKLRIKYESMLLVDKYRTSVQVAVDQRLGVIHKTEFEPCHLRFQGLVAVNFLLHKIFHRRKDVVSAVVVEDRLAKHEILRDVAQFRVGELTHQSFTFLMIHDDIGGHQKTVHKKCTDLFRKLRIHLMMNQSGAHHCMPDHILHDHGAHYPVIEVYLRNQSRAQSALEFQNAGLNPSPVCGQSHFIRNTKMRSRLLDNDGTPAFFILHPENIIKIAVADLSAGKRRLRVKIMELRLHVIDDVRLLHQKIAAEIRQINLPLSTGNVISPVCLLFNLRPACSPENSAQINTFAVTVCTATGNHLLLL